RLSANATAQQVVQAITALYANNPALPKPSATFEPTSNLVLVTATVLQHDEIKQKVIDPIDAATQWALKNYVVTLQHAKAESIVDTLKEYFTNWKKSRGDRPVDSISITASATTNALLVTATDSAKKELDDVLKNMDSETGGVKTKTFALKHAAAADSVVNI